jgi:hypothetical protein
VATPVEVPLTVTLTPGKGAPLPASVTLPLTALSCEKALVDQHTSSGKMNKSTFFPIIKVRLVYVTFNIGIKKYKRKAIMSYNICVATLL